MGAPDKELKRIFPLFTSWVRLYIFIFIELGALILLFYLFSRAFA